MKSIQGIVVLFSLIITSNSFAGVVEDYLGKYSSYQDLVPLFCSKGHLPQAEIRKVLEKQGKISKYEENHYSVQEKETMLGKMRKLEKTTFELEEHPKVLITLDREQYDDRVLLNGSFSISIISPTTGRRSFLSGVMLDGSNCDQALPKIRMLARADHDEQGELTHVHQYDLTNQSEESIDFHLTPKSLEEIYAHCSALPEGKTFEAIHQIAQNTDKVLVAIIDSGVNYDLPQLAYKIPRDSKGTLRGWNVLANSPFPIDGNYSGAEDFSRTAISQDRGHGTAVAEIASRENDNVEIVPVKLVEADGIPRFHKVNFNEVDREGEANNEVLAFEKAYTAGARVFNMSYGRVLDNEEQERHAKGLSCKFMKEHDDVLFVVAAGNSGLDLNDKHRDPGSCGNLPNVLIVAGVDDKNNIAGHVGAGSNFGSKVVHLAAPFTIKSVDLYGYPRDFSGTSFAAPYVTNIAAKIKKVNPNLTPEQIIEILMRKVDKHEHLKDKLISGGVVNKERALKKARKSLH